MAVYKVNLGVANVDDMEQRQRLISTVSRALFSMRMGGRARDSRNKPKPRSCSTYNVTIGIPVYIEVAKLAIRTFPV